MRSTGMGSCEVVNYTKGRVPFVVKITIIPIQARSYDQGYYISHYFGKLEKVGDKTPGELNQQLQSAQSEENEYSWLVNDLSKIEERMGESFKRPSISSLTNKAAMQKHQDGLRDESARGARQPKNMKNIIRSRKRENRGSISISSDSSSPMQMRRKRPIGAMGQGAAERDNSPEYSESSSPRQRCNSDETVNIRTSSGYKAVYLTSLNYMSSSYTSCSGETTIEGTSSSSGGNSGSTSDSGSGRMEEDGQWDSNSAGSEENDNYGEEQKRKRVRNNHNHENSVRLIVEHRQESSDADIKNDDKSANSTDDGQDSGNNSGSAADSADEVDSSTSSSSANGRLNKTKMKNLLNEVSAHLPPLPKDTKNNSEDINSSASHPFVLAAIEKTIAANEENGNQESRSAFENSWRLGGSVNMMAVESAREESIIAKQIASRNGFSEFGKELSNSNTANSMANSNSVIAGVGVSPPSNTSNSNSTDFQKARTSGRRGKSTGDAEDVAKISYSLVYHGDREVQVPSSFSSRYSNSNSKPANAEMSSMEHSNGLKEFFYVDASGIHYVDSV